MAVALPDGRSEFRNPPEVGLGDPPCRVDYDAEQWHSRWQSLLELLKNPYCKKPLNYEEDYQLIEQTIKSGQYALHHSRLFNETYRQHYRIVRRDVFEQMLLPLIESFESAKPSSPSNPTTLNP